MKACLIACIFVVALAPLQGCSLQKPDGQAAVESSKDMSAHGDERNIGGHLYRHGRNIHHHHERMPPKEEKAAE